jgi:hypothetical protein
MMTENIHPPQSCEPDNDPFPEPAPKRRVDPMILWGAWPGEEPVEFLMEDLAVVCLRLQKDRRAKPSET